MPITSSSTGKSKVKRPQSKRMTEYSTCSKLLSNSVHKKDYERPQPIKIAQLLRLPENVKGIPQDSVRKRTQPERLGALSNKKNIRANVEQSGIQIESCKKHVRRFLNFNGTPINATKNNNENKTQPDKSEQFHHKISKPIKKRSLLLPPNAIKDKYLEKCNVNITRQSTIYEISREIDEINTDSKNENKITSESLAVNINSAVPSKNRQIYNEQKIVQCSNNSKPNPIDINRVQLLETLHVALKSSQQIITNNENQVFTQNNSIHEKFIPNKSALKCDISSKPKETDNCIQNLYNDIEDIKLVASGNCTNVESPEVICINKDKIIRLEHDLKDLLKETEERIPKLRSLLTHVTELLVKDRDITSDTENRSNKMMDKGVQVETCCKSVQYSEEQLKTPITHIPQITVINKKDSNESKSTGNDENKENDRGFNIRRMSDTAVADGSFLELENQLNIMHAKPIQNYLSKPKTPKSLKKCKLNRSLREYMALKSNINFLETPDSKKFKSLCQVDSIDKSVNVTYISNKLLTDLQNLYSESPDS
ncbi:uncharacterized protein LOC105665735 isoform X1 [Bombus terrestris]|uniref:Uncharacterized protein LOC105665735 isoform X1 n=2 Tax=Bombus terrestris TaxID=30195 RepID=A0A9B7CV70_BOMTE|nr:uncharacterized protein LOC105665735 isoform X1 [Bombus terrestris]